jgi:hypothetical protein
MSTTTTPHPDVPVPDGSEPVRAWDLEGYRDLYGFDRTVTDHEVRVYAFGSQATDGTIYDRSVHIADGENAGPILNSDQARELAAALLAAAAEVDGWQS